MTSQKAKQLLIIKKELISSETGKEEDTGDRSIEI